MATKRGLRTYRDEIYPDKTLDVFQENVDLFFKFMHRRQLVWHRRFISHLPKEQWTKDEIIKRYKYTNVYRQLDRGTLWVYYNILQPMYQQYCNTDDAKEKNRIFKNLIWKTIVYRLCCRVETFEKVGIPDYWNYDPAEYYAQLVGVLDHHRVMTNAFLTCPCPSGMTKVQGYMISLMDVRFKLARTCHNIAKAKTGEDVFKAMRPMHGMGAFFAYEVYCDLCYSKIIPFTTNDFVNVGPGCMEGLRMLFPSIGTKVSEGHKRLYWLFDNQHKEFERLEINFKFMNWLEPIKNKLSLRTIEHSLCEFSKYWLQRQEMGKRRLEYNKWKTHPNFTVNDDGITTTSDKTTYDNFTKMSNSYRIKSKKWLKMLEDAKKTSPDKATIVDYIKNNVI